MEVLHRVECCKVLAAIVDDWLTAAVFHEKFLGNCSAIMCGLLAGFGPSFYVRAEIEVSFVVWGVRKFLSFGWSCFASGQLGSQIVRRYWSGFEGSLAGNKVER